MFQAQPHQDDTNNMVELKFNIYMAIEMAKKDKIIIHAG